MPNPLSVLPWPVRSPISSKRVSARSRLTGSSSCPSSSLAQSMVRRDSASTSLSPAASASSTARVHQVMARCVVALLLAEPAVPAEQLGPLPERGDAALRPRAGAAPW